MTDGDRLLGGVAFLQTGWKSQIRTSPHGSEPWQGPQGPAPPTPGGDHSILPLSLALVYVSVPAASRLPTPVCTRPPCLSSSCLMLCGLFFPSSRVFLLPGHRSGSPSLPLSRLSSCPRHSLPLHGVSPYLPPSWCGPWASPSHCPWSLNL